MSEILHEDSVPVYTLGITSKLSNTPLHSIRQYIDKGLIRTRQKPTDTCSLKLI